MTGFIVTLLQHFSSSFSVLSYYRADNVPVSFPRNERLFRMCGGPRGTFLHGEGVFGVGDDGAGGGG